MPECLRIEKLCKKYATNNFGEPIKHGVHAVHDVSFTIGQNESFGLIGESGCGKSTIGRLILGLEKPTSGEIWMEGARISALRGAEWKQQRKTAQIIFQDVDGSLNPRHKVSKLLAEPFRVHGISHEQYAPRIKEVMTQLNIGAELLNRYPSQMSGGQRQRVSLARSVALRPRFLVADEPAASLDISIQAQVLALLNKLRREYGMSLLYISHNLRIIRQMTERVGVMYLGSFVEEGDTENLFTNPLHPYTQILLSSLPVSHPRDRTAQKQIIRGEITERGDNSAGCLFAERCPRCMPVCRIDAPQTRTISENQKVACHLYTQEGAL